MRRTSIGQFSHPIPISIGPLRPGSSVEAAQCGVGNEYGLFRLFKLDAIEHMCLEPVGSESFRLIQREKGETAFQSGWFVLVPEARGFEHHFAGSAIMIPPVELNNPAPVAGENDGAGSKHPPAEME